MKRRLKPEIYNTLSDKKALEARFFQLVGKKLDLRHPQTYSEKLQWLKLYDRRPEYTTMVDKYAVKKYIADKIGEEYVVPLLGVWDRAEDIDFDALPEQFVLKTNHDTASVLVCKDKSIFDRERAIKHLSGCLNTNSFLWGREWPYKNVKRRVFAEAFLKNDASDDLPDYKFFCFDGKVRFFLIATDRYKKGEKTKLDFFYPDGTHIDARYGYPNAKTPPPLPSKLEEMMRLAEILSKGIPHVRVDFYECNGKVYFGELTFYTGCGFIPFTPDVWDETFGSFIKLPKKTVENPCLFARACRRLSEWYKDRRLARMVDLLTPGYCEKLPDKRFLKLKYLQLFEKKLDLRHPKTYNEKLQWLKLYDRKPEYTPMVDKYEAKRIVAEKIGEEYTVPTLGVWDRAEDIDFDALPEQFVLKCTHDSGSVVICHDKATFDKAAALEKLGRCLQKNPFDYGREWPYKNVKPRIIAEPYLEDEKTGELPDYKFFCFDGLVRALFVATDRQKEGEETKFDFFDADGKRLALRHGHPNALTPPALPAQFELMKKLAATLSKGFPHLRVDFYECNGKIYFGEFTFYHHAGFVPFDPPIWDETFGAWLTLPEKKTR